MLYLALAVSVLASLVSTQSLSDIPACALNPCFIPAISESGCGLDVTCLCSSATFIASVKSCVPLNCEAADVATTLAVANEMCAGYPGFPLSI